MAFPKYTLENTAITDMLPLIDTIKDTEIDSCTAFLNQLNTMYDQAHDHGIDSHTVHETSNIPYTTLLQYWSLVIIGTVACVKVARMQLALYQQPWQVDTTIENGLLAAGVVTIVAIGLNSLLANIPDDEGL